VNPTLDEIVIGDEPEAWRAAGFSVDDDGVCRIGTVRVRLRGRAEGKRIRSWSVRDPEPGSLAAGTIDGLRSEVSTTAPCAGAEHANGVTHIDHVVLVTPDVARTVSALESVGWDVRRTRETDQYGPPFTQTFFRAGEVLLELIGPAEPSGDGPAAFFGLAHTVADLDATARLLGPLLGAVKEAVQPGRRIATLRHKEIDVSVATAFMTA
jgi:hypothetical protein